LGLPQSGKPAIVALGMSDLQKHGAELLSALREGHTVTPLIERDPSLTIDDAYAISLNLLARRQAEGERIIGKKIGVTSKAVQDMLGVHQPDFGFLTDTMLIEGDIDVAANRLIQPRAEAEVAFFLRDSLKGPEVTAKQVIAATECIAPCFEIVDSRIENWNISIIDTVADNASCGVFLIGEAQVDPRDFDLPSLKVTVTKNGKPLSEGHGRDVQGNPAQAVAWLANTLGRYGVTLDAGDVILSGSMVPLEDARAGDLFEMMLEGIGGCTARFV
jgi:2-oxopent-4-enoate/cis-2-oxohex-4-enoate hydratase